MILIILYQWSRRRRLGIMIRLLHIPSLGIWILKAVDQPISKSGRFKMMRWILETSSGKYHKGRKDERKESERDKKLRINKRRMKRTKKQKRLLRRKKMQDEEQEEEEKESEAKVKVHYEEEEEESKEETT
jgi:hypothetical protein